MLETKFVVDTTVLVAALIKPDGLSGKIVRSLELDLYSPHKAIDELWKNSSGWSSKNPSVSLGKFVENLQYFLKLQNVDPNSLQASEAKRIMDPIDPDDTEFIALALSIDAPIWSYDSHFQRQERVKVVGARGTSFAILLRFPLCLKN